MEEDSQPETFINKTDKFKTINWVQWSKEFEKYVAQYKTAQKAGASLFYVIHNNLKRSDPEAMALLPQTEQEYRNITIDNRNMRYVEYPERVYSLLEELMLGTDGYEWLGEVSTRNRNGIKYFGNLQTHYDGPREHLKHVAEANQILENIHNKNKNIAVTFEVYVTRIKES